MLKLNFPIFLEFNSYNSNLIHPVQELVRTYLNCSSCDCEIELLDLNLYFNSY